MGCTEIPGYLKERSQAGRRRNPCTSSLKGYFSAMKSAHSILLALALLWVSILTAQEIPVEPGHPVYPFLEREHRLGHITPDEFGVLPYTRSEISDLLHQLDRQLPMEARQRTLLKRFLVEFQTDDIPSGMTGFWQGSRWGEVFRDARAPFPDRYRDPHCITYRGSEVLGWADFEEGYRLESDGDHSRSLWHDQLTFSGTFLDQISFQSHYVFYRLENVAGFDPEFPTEYRQGYVLDHEESGWRVWDDSRATLAWHNAFARIELSKAPIIWGFGGRNSPILSGNVASFPHFGFHFRTKHFNLSSFDGALVAFADLPGDSLMPEKRLAGHRFELDASKNLTLAFSELVVYGNRGLETGYLLPLSLFVTQEHQLGDRDNVVIAFEGWYRLQKGLSVFGTLFMDELDWVNLFKPWWGNKVVFQTGLGWVPASDPRIPELNLTLTLARPWVYTHDDTVSSYTAAGRGLGLPLGPNSQQLELEAIS